MKRKKKPNPDWHRALPKILLLAVQAVLHAELQGHLEWLWQLLS